MLRRGLQASKGSSSEQKSKCTNIRRKLGASTSNYPLPAGSETQDGTDVLLQALKLSEPGPKILQISSTLTMSMLKIFLLLKRQFKKLIASVRRKCQIVRGSHVFATILLLGSRLRDTRKLRSTQNLKSI